MNVKASEGQSYSHTHTMKVCRGIEVSLCVL